MIIGALQRKLNSDVAGFLIGYIPNLIVSPILLVISILFQPWFWLDFTWGIIGTAFGLILSIVMIILGGDVVPRWGKHAKVLAPWYMDGWGGAVSLGPVLTGYRRFSNWTHEYGHTWQNRILGPLYIFIIGIPSLISASTSSGSHSSFYTETWADSWGTWP